MKILLATDGSEHAAEAGAFLNLLPLAAGSFIHVLCVVDPFVEELLCQVRPAEAEWPRRVAEGGAAAVRREGVEVTTEVRAGDAAREITRAARERGADLIVVGSQGLSGLEEILLGSVARNVTRSADRPVLVVRPVRYGLERALLATDGSEHAAAAERFLSRFPLPAATTVTAVSVVSPYHPWFGLSGLDDAVLVQALQEEDRYREEQARRLAGTAAAALREAGKRAAAEVRQGDPSAEIAALAREQSVDLVAAGARGVSLIEGLLLGSVADRLLKKAPCSVLVVR